MRAFSFLGKAVKFSIKNHKNLSRNSSRGAFLCLNINQYQLTSINFLKLNFMKKSILLLSVLAMGTSLYAQQDQGRVGINTTKPKATLDINVASANADTTTNEGIIAPKLTKERIAKIAVPQEGTLVYAKDAIYSGTNSKVAKITEKGYYFYNGTEWVKVRGADTNIANINIYTEDGTLSANRTVNLNNKTLTFKGTNAQIKVPNIAEVDAQNNNTQDYNVVIGGDGTLKKDDRYWYFWNEVKPDTERINKTSMFIFQNGVVEPWWSEENKTSNQELFMIRSPNLFDSNGKRVTEGDSSGQTYAVMVTADDWLSAMHMFFMIPAIRSKSCWYGVGGILPIGMMFKRKYTDWHILTENLPWTDGGTTEERYWEKKDTKPLRADLGCLLSIRY
ncbi:hypothetical protein MWN41_00685 [Ornithobacterium rhinotracheale]|nr:hypothetical protein [Ornithobacterium rhinotracheale]MCK0201532.1 hypothetical protein [Ornithobacterium rhinotracheale]